MDIRVYPPSALFRFHFTRDKGIAALISERGKALTDRCYGFGHTVQQVNDLDLGKGGVLKFLMSGGLGSGKISVCWLLEAFIPTPLGLYTRE